MTISDDDVLQRINTLWARLETRMESLPLLEEAFCRLIGDIGEICLQLGTLYSYQSRHREAAEMYELITPTTMLGSAYFSDGRYEDAQRAYRVATQTPAPEPDDVSVLAPGVVTLSYFGELSANVDAALRADQLGLLPPHNELTLPSKGKFAKSALREIWRSAGVGDSNKATHKVHVDVMPIHDGRLLPRVLAHATYRTGRPLISADWHPAQWDILGVRPGDPFVVIHVREATSYSQEALPWYPNKFRNADPLTYIPAIKYLTSLGIKVFRIGDNKMTPMPDIPGFVDLATRPDPRPDWMDIFLSANALFFLATASGPYTLAHHFGTPILGTNWFPLGWWLYDDNQMLIHKTLKKRSMREAMEPPFFGALRPDHLDPEETVIDNTADEIVEAVKIMLNGPRTAPPSPPAADPLGIGVVSRLAYPEHCVEELWG